MLYLIDIGFGGMVLKIRNLGSKHVFVCLFFTFSSCFLSEGSFISDMVKLFEGAQFWSLN